MREFWVAECIKSDLPDFIGDIEISRDFWAAEYFINLRKESSPDERWRIFKVVEVTKDSLKTNTKR